MPLFKKKDPVEKLSKKYRQLLQKAHEVSHTNRAEGDRLMAEADAVAAQIEQLRQSN